MKKKMILLVAAIVAAAVMLSGCGKINSYSAEEYFKPYISGYNGNGVFRMDIDMDMEERIVEECMPKDATQMEKLQCYILLETMEWDASPEKNLSNGDKVKIKIKCNENALAANKIRFTNTEFTYTVSGLEEAVVVDLTKDVEVTFDGFSPNGKATAEYVGNDDFIRKNVRYECIGDVVNGGTVTVQAKYNNSVFEANNLIVDENTSEREFIVSGLDEYLHERTDFSEIDKIIDTEFRKAIKKKELTIGSEISPVRFLDYDSVVSYKNYRVSDSSDMPVKNVFIYSGDGAITLDGKSSYKTAYNQYVRFYKVTVEVEKKSDYGGIDDLNLQIGDKKTVDVYFVFCIEDIVMNGDGSMTYNSDDVWYSTYRFNPNKTVDFSDVYKDFMIESRTNNDYEIIFEEDL